MTVFIVSVRKKDTEPDDMGPMYVVEAENAVQACNAAHAEHFERERKFERESDISDFEVTTLHLTEYVCVIKAP